MVEESGAAHLGGTGSVVGVKLSRATMVHKPPLSTGGRFTPKGPYTVGKFVTEFLIVSWLDKSPLLDS